MAPDPAGYEIRVAGHLDQHWADWLGNVHLVRLADGTTAIRCGSVDQAELHGLLTRIRDLGVPLISVTGVS